MKTGGQILWNATAVCETFKTSCLTERPCERRCGQPFNGLVIHIGYLVEYHPISARDWPRLHEFGKKVLPGFFFGCALHAMRIMKGDILLTDIGEFGTGARI